MIKLNSIAKLLAFISGMLISLTIIFYIYSYTLKNQLSEQGQNIFIDLLDASRQAFSVIDLLNKQDFSNCSDENLLKMRKYQFQSNDIKDIGFFKNDLLICTTGVGILEKPIKESMHDYMFEGHKFWFDHKLITFDMTIQGIVIHKGNYNVAMSIKSILNEHLKFKEYEVLAKKGDEITHLYGKSGVFQHKATSSKQYFSTGLLSHSLEFCGPKGGVCVAVHHKNFSEFQTVLILLILILISLISGITALHVYGWIYSYIYSTKRRVKLGLSFKCIKPHYQAIVELKTDKVIGCELLARFEDNIGPLYPDQFISVVSELDMSWQMTETLILQAIDDFKDIQADDTPFYLSINVFPKDINNGNILKGIELLKDVTSNLQIFFEVTEDEELHFNKIGNTLETLSKSRIKISIDDFGTGYSNLSQLKLLDIDTLKIDKSFVDEVETGSIRSTLIPYIVSIADNLEATVIAEGIENRLQVDELLKMDIEFGQGWYYSKALPLKEFKNYLICNSDYKFGYE
ncbi:EAL domain-containing protein [Colwellia piezophila]|uniref:EAL domain-containing protein n=1 Tax=Colwellia piezophila TaxID=211668 RepID=UPI0003656F2C|nr:EAL domain-containing protein [Colwellia piezophila]